MLEKTNRSDSSNSACKTLGGVFEGDATDGEHGDIDGAADLNKTLKPLRLTEGCF